MKEKEQSNTCEQTFAGGSRSLGWNATDKGMSSKAFLDVEEEVNNFFPHPTLFKEENDGDVDNLFKRKD